MHLFISGESNSILLYRRSPLKPYQAHSTDPQNTLTLKRYDFSFLLFIYYELFPHDIRDAGLTHARSRSLPLVNGVCTWGNRTRNLPLNISFFHKIQ